MKTKDSALKCGMEWMKFLLFKSIPYGKLRSGTECHLERMQNLKIRQIFRNIFLMEMVKRL